MSKLHLQPRFDLTLQSADTSVNAQHVPQCPGPAQVQHKAPCAPLHSIASHITFSPNFKQPGTLRHFLLASRLMSLVIVLICSYTNTQLHCRNGTRQSHTALTHPLLLQLHRVEECKEILTAQTGKKATANAGTHHRDPPAMGLFWQDGATALPERAPRECTGQCESLVHPPEQKLPPAMPSTHRHYLMYLEGFGFKPKSPRNVTASGQ